jgi:uncharacterized tellurite resistance protein B-like protein
MSQRITLDGLSLRERSEYFRGLLLVMAADGELHDAERELIKHAISPFDFSAEFVEESIESILKNKHVSQVPPRFESQANACLFLRAALDIAFGDGVLDETEEKWLRATADLNGIAAEWLEEQIAERE